MLKITSLKNKLIKNVVLLQSKSRERKKQGLIVVEGLKEISIALSSGLDIKQVFFCSEIISLDYVTRILKNKSEDFDIYDLSKEVFAKISYRESTGGLIIVAKTPQKSLNNLKTSDNSLFIILESVEKPGNLGAVARIADGAGVNGIIIADPLTDIYNPNVIRASLGCVFTKDIVTAKFEEVKKWIKENNIKCFATQLNTSNYYHNFNYENNVAFVFGTEATGLTDKWIQLCNDSIKIPMAGHIDSLNVSVSVAVVVYEAIRQRSI